MTGCSTLAHLPLPGLALIAWKFRSGADSIVEQHDVLDFSAGVLNRLTFGDLFASPGATVPHLLGGLDRGFIGSELHLGHVTFALLPLLWAFIVNELAMRSLAHVGMHLLLGRLGLDRDPLVSWGGAAVFSLLPFYSMGFGAVAGFPLLLWAFVATVQTCELRRGPLAVFALTPLYMAAYAAIPYWLLLSVASGAIAIACRPAALRPMTQALVVFGTAIVIADWRLLLISATGPTSHRVDMVAERPWRSVFDGIGGSVFAESQHAYAGRSLAIGGALVIGLAVATVGSTNLTDRLRLGAALCLAMFIFGTVVSRVWPWFEAAVLAEVLGEWSRFQMSRLRWAEPALIITLAALSVGALRQTVSCAPAATKRAFMTLTLVLTAAQLTTVINAHAFRAAPDSLTLRQYFAAETMADVRAAFEADDGERTVSVRLHPSVAVQNGIPSADGYWTAYDRDYKAEFRSLIAPTLEEHPADAAYFDRWGSRAYVFLGDQGRTRCCAEPLHTPVTLAISPSAMEPLGITHVISGSEIINAAELNLELVGDFGRANELGQVLLYRRLS